jgi:hypothetical protein
MRTTEGNELCSGVHFLGGVGWSGTEFIIIEAATGLTYHPWMIMDDDKCPDEMYDECGIISGILRRGSRSTWRNPVSVPICAPQIQHDLSRI